MEAQMKLMSIETLAGVLGVPRSRAYELLRRNVIPVVRIGRQVRVAEDALRAWITSGGRGLEPGDQGNRHGGHRRQSSAP
jgi:excisionase family DNA binding protein